MDLRHRNHQRVLGGSVQRLASALESCGQPGEGTCSGLGKGSCCWALERMRPKKEECVILACVTMISVSSVTIVLCIAVHFTLYRYPALFSLLPPPTGDLGVLQCHFEACHVGPIGSQLPRRSGALGALDTVACSERKRKDRMKGCTSNRGGEFSRGKGVLSKGVNMWTLWGGAGSFQASKVHQK